MGTPHWDRRRGLLQGNRYSVSEARIRCSGSKFGKQSPTDLDRRSASTAEIEESLKNTPSVHRSATSPIRHKKASSPRLSRVQIRGQKGVSPAASQWESDLRGQSACSDLSQNASARKERYASVSLSGPSWIKRCSPRLSASSADKKVFSAALRGSRASRPQPVPETRPHFESRPRNKGPDQPRPEMAVTMLSPSVGRWGCSACPALAASSG